MNRYWINQPSKLQPHNEHHGQNVLANKKNILLHHQLGPAVEAYFTKGKKVSTMIQTRALANGWK